MAENVVLDCSQNHDDEEQRYIKEFSDSNDNTKKKKEAFPGGIRSTSFKSTKETSSSSSSVGATTSFSESNTTAGGDKTFRFPQRNRVLSNESHTFLDRFRSQASSKSLNYSPSRSSQTSQSFKATTANNNSNSRNNTHGKAGRSSSVNVNRNYTSSSNSASTEFSSNSTSKPRKWYSFTNLLSSQNLANILSYPARSRLSVSSTLNSVFIGNSSPAETPTPSDDFQHGFFNGAFNFYQSQQHPQQQQQQQNAQGGESRSSRVPLSPTPSCVTISGDYPSRFFFDNNNPNSSFAATTESLLRRGGAGRRSEIQRRAKTSSFNSEKHKTWDESEGTWKENENDDCNNDENDIFNNPARASISPFQDNSNNSSISGVSVHRPSSASSSIGYNNKRLSRLSCGEFFPSSSLRNSSIYTDSDTESLEQSSESPSNFFNNQINQHQQSRTNNKTTSVRNRKALGRSLPTLLQAMESANNGYAGLHTGSVTTQDVFDLLYQEFVILTGAKSIDDHYIMIFPDRGNFHLLEDSDYRRLMLYLCAVPPMSESESGFVIVVDRRQDKWNSVKQTLLRISVFFPGVIHRVFVLRPVGFLQKALSEVSSKLFRTENLRFNLTVCNNVSDLYVCIQSSQLTEDFGGSIHYDKIKWVQQRIEVEAFGVALQVLSTDLKVFTLSFHDLEYPNDVEETQKLLQDKETESRRLMEELQLASEHGEYLLQRIKRGGQVPENNGDGSNNFTQQKQPSSSNVCGSSSVQLINVISVERFILQIEDTSRLFQDFWAKEKSELEQCLKLRRFEHDFKELQGAFDLNVKKLNSIPDVGTDVQATLKIIEETRSFQELTMQDVNRAIDLEKMGRHIVSNDPSALAVDTVEPKCIELKRMTTHFRFILEEKLQALQDWSQVQLTIEKANQLCTEGMDILSRPQQAVDNIEDCVDSGVLVKKIDVFLEVVQNISDEIMKSINSIGSTQSTKLLKQVHKRVEDLQAVMQTRRSSVLQNLNKTKLRRTSGSGSNNSSISPNNLSVLSDQKTNSKSTSQLQETGKAELPIGESSLKQASSTLSLDGSAFNGKSSETLESRRIKRGHVLKELLHTETSYVNEIGDILNGYRQGVEDKDLKILLPKQLLQSSSGFGTEITNEPKLTNMSVLFGNLEDIHSFHFKSFLPDLSNCIKSVELVGLCFIQRHVEFITLYSKYCQLLPASEALRREIGENHPWFLSCRQRLNHKLPLGAYLLKPVQRITKYQLLLKDLLKNSEGCEGYKVLLEALEHMLIVLRCVDDGMLQLSIVHYPGRLQDEGPLLLQGSFMLWTETKKDRLRLKGHQRHLFLYQKSILICKKDKDPKSTSLYFKTKINLSEIGLTEVLRGSGSSKKFEIWIQGRLKVFILQAESMESKDQWVQSIKKLLMEQLESLRINKSASGVGVSTNVSVSTKRHKMMNQHKGMSMNGWKSNPAASSHRPLRQTSSWVASDSRPRSRTSTLGGDVEDDGLSSDLSNSDDDESYSLNLPNNDHPSSLPLNQPIYAINSQSSCVYGSGESIENGPKYVALADYNSMGSAEISFKKGDVIILRKLGHAGWWFVSAGEGSGANEGWAPSAFLERLDCALGSSTTSVAASGSSNSSQSNSTSTPTSQHFNPHPMQQNSNQSTEGLTSLLR